MKSSPTISRPASSTSSNHPAAASQTLDPLIPEMPTVLDDAVSHLKIHHSENDASYKVVAAMFEEMVVCASDASRVEIATHSGIQAITTAIQKAIAISNVQAHRCRALSAITINADNRNKIANVGGIDAVVMATEQHLGSVRV